MKHQVKILLLILGAGLLIGVSVWLIARKTHDATQAGGPTTSAPDAAKETRPPGTDAPATAAADVGTGAGKVVLSLNFPPGYKINDEAPTTVALRADGKVVRFGASEKVSDTFSARQFDKPSFPLEVPVEIAAGEGAVSVEMRLYYCREGDAAACFFKDALMELPVRAVAGGSEHDLNIVYEVKR